MAVLKEVSGRKQHPILYAAIDWYKFLLGQKGFLSVASHGNHTPGPAFSSPTYAAFQNAQKSEFPSSNW